MFVSGSVMSQSPQCSGLPVVTGEKANSPLGDIWTESYEVVGAAALTETLCTRGRNTWGIAGEKRSCRKAGHAGAALPLRSAWPMGPRANGLLVSDRPTRTTSFTPPSSTLDQDLGFSIQVTRLDTW